MQANNGLILRQHRKASPRSNLIMNPRDARYGHVPVSMQFTMAAASALVTVPLLLKSPLRMLQPGNAA